MMKVAAFIILIVLSFLGVVSIAAKIAEEDKALICIQGRNEWVLKCAKDHALYACQSLAEKLFCEERGKNAVQTKY